MLTVLSTSDMLAESAVEATGGGILLSLRADPDVPALHHAVVRRGSETLHVALDRTTGVAEVISLGALAVAA